MKNHKKNKVKIIKIKNPKSLKVKNKVFTSKDIAKILKEKKKRIQYELAEKKDKCQLRNRTIFIVISGLPRVSEYTLMHFRKNVINTLEEQGANVYLCCTFWNEIGGRIKWKSKNQFVPDLSKAKNMISDIHKKEKTFIKYIHPGMFSNEAKELSTEKINYHDFKSVNLRVRAFYQYMCLKEAYAYGRQIAKEMNIKPDIAIRTRLDIKTRIIENIVCRKFKPAHFYTHRKTHKKNKLYVKDFFWVHHWSMVESLEKWCKEIHPAESPEHAWLDIVKQYKLNLEQVRVNVEKVW